MDKENLNGIPEEEIIKCSHCQKNAATENSDYCDVCETALLKKKIPFFGWAAGFVSLMLGIVVFTIMISGAVLTAGFGKSNEYADKKVWYAAYEQYYEDYRESVESLNVINDFLNTVFDTEERAYVSPGLGIKKNMIEVVANCYSPLDAYYYATGFLSEKEISMSFMADYEKVYTDFNSTYSAVEEIFNKAYTDGADYKALLTEMDTYKGKEGVNEVFLNYHKYVIAVNLGASASEQLEILKDVEKAAEASGDDYSWLCNPTMAQALYDTGDFDGTMVYLDRIIESNKSSYEAYKLKMKIQVMNGDVDAAGETVAEYRANHENCELLYYADVLEIEYLRITGDYDKAKALCTEADESYRNVPETNGIMDLTYMIESKLIMPTEIYRQNALILLSEGDYAQAFTVMMDAYQMESYYANYFQGSANLNDPNFYSVLYLSAKLLSTSDRMTAEIQPDVDNVLAMFSGGKMSDKITAVENGEKTVEEVLREGDFELI